MRALLHLDIDPVVGRQNPLQPRPDGEADDGDQRAVVDGGRDLDQDPDQGVGVLRRRGGWRDVDIREVDDGELAERERRVLRV